MNKDAALEYLNDYVNDPKFVTLADMTVADRDLLPQSWQHLLSAHAAERLQRMVAAWQDFQAELVQTIEFLKVYLAGVELIHRYGAYSLLYAVKRSSSEKVRYYEARNPKLRKPGPAIETAWPRFPAKFRRLYQEFHDGVLAHPAIQAC